MTPFKDLNSRISIKSKVLRSIFIVLGIGIGYVFFSLKDFFDGTFDAMKDNAVLSFVVRGGLTFLAGLILFFGLLFFEAVFLTSNHGVEEDRKETEEPRRRARIKQKKGRR